MGGLFGQWHERACVVQVALGKPDAGHDPEYDRAASDYVVLRAADAVPHAGSGRSQCVRPVRLRHCTSAGEPLNPEVIRAWREGTGGLTVYDGYGQSETTAGRQLPRHGVRPGSMGKPVPG